MANRAMLETGVFMPVNYANQQPKASCERWSAVRLKLSLTMVHCQPRRASIEQAIHRFVIGALWRASRRFLVGFVFEGLAFAVFFAALASAISANTFSIRRI